MSLPVPVTKRYKPVDRRCGMAEWPHLRVEKVRLEAGHLNPVAFQFNEIGFVLSGRAVTSYSGNGLKQQFLIEQGTARLCPAGIFERDVVLDAAIECLFISLPSGLIQESALNDDDIDPAKAELVHAGGLVDPTLQRIAPSFHDMLRRGIEVVTDRLFVDGMQAALAAHLLGTYSVDRWHRPEKAPQIDPRKRARVLDDVDAHYADNIARIETGSIWINLASYTAPELPFGGVKRSGYGRELSEYGIKEMVNQKLVLVAAA